MKIGKVEIEGKAALAPLAGVTDIPFRKMCKEQGAAVVFSEMVSSEGLVRGSEKTNRYLKFLEGERPIALQLFGSKPDVMGEASRIIEEHDPDFIDINFGCPVKKIVRNEAGSALLKNPPLMGKIVNAMVKSVSIPVTAKIRCGWDENSMPVSDIGKILEDNGVSAISIHARTRQMQFTGKAAWSEIRKLKEAVSVPVFGNGDVNTTEDAKRMIEETGCDMIMIGRGAMGNPWIFKHINHYLETGKKLPDPSVSEKISICLRQMKASLELYGSGYMANTMKKHIAWYLKGIPNGTLIKSKIFNEPDYAAMLDILENFLDSIPKKKLESRKAS
jgi:tRNA-dihydrouridine synthase B